LDHIQKDRLEAEEKLTKQRTIVFYIATLTRGGAERVIVSLANHFYRQGYRVYMVTLEPDEGLYPMEAGIRQVVVRDSSGRGLWGRLGGALGRITQVRSLLRDTRARALVAFIGKTNLRAVLAGLGLRTKVFVSVRSAPSREYPPGVMRFLARSLFRLADGVVFQSEGARSFFPAAVRRKSRILYNPLSPEYVRETPYRGERRDEIITMGRMDRVKNHALLVDAFSLVVKEKPWMHLTIYGDGPCMKEIRAQVERLGLAGKVALPGDTRNVAEKIRDARIFVLSSDFEGMPNAVAEAFAVGAVVVSTDCPSGGAAALVQDGERGLLVPVGDQEKMAAAIVRILNDRELEERLRDNAFRFSRTLFPDKINGLWQDYIETVCGE